MSRILLMLDPHHFDYYPEVHSVSFKTMVWVLNHSDAKGSDRLVLLSLASHENGRAARPSTARIAREAAIDPSTVFKVLRRLEDSKAIDIDRGGRGRGRTSLYYVLTENMADCHQACCKSGRSPDTYLASGHENVASGHEKSGRSPDEPLKSLYEPPKARVATGQIFKSKPGRTPDIGEEPHNPLGAGKPCLGDPCPDCGEAWTLGHRCET